MGKASKRMLLSMLGVFVAGGMAWALVTVLQPPADPLDANDYALVEVVPGEVGESIQLNTVAAWAPAPIASNRAAGVVTQVVAAPGAEVSQGSMLYTVDLRPVVVAQGAVPAFRDVGDGAEGNDVRQMQQMLADLGFYQGEVDGSAGSRTIAAIRAWQKSLGTEQTGVVATGDVIFVPTLPTRVSLDEKVVYPGASLGGGERILSGLAAAPELSMPVTDTQAAMIPSGTRVEITSPEGDLWTAFAGEQVKDATSGTVTVKLQGQDGAVICGDQCGQVPVSGQVTLLSKIVTVETATGLVVPSSALVSEADGKLAVIDEHGERVPVKVVAGARGMSVIEGADTGIKVRVPGKPRQ